MAASIGAVVILNERDYLYGTGPIKLRLEHVDHANPVYYDGESWFPVEGVQLTGDGAELGRRQVLVRGQRLQP